MVFRLSDKFYQEIFKHSLLVLRKSQSVLYSLHTCIIFAERALGTSESCCSRSADIQDGVCCLSLGEGNHTSTACDAVVQKQPETLALLVYR